MKIKNFMCQTLSLFLSLLIVLSMVTPFSVFSEEAAGITLTADEESNVCSADISLSSTDQAKNSVLYIAFYNGNNSVIKTVVNENPSTTVTYNATIPTGAEFVKAMLWEKGTNAPLCREAIKPIFTSSIKTGLLYGIESVTLPSAKIRVMETPAPDYVNSGSFADYMVETYAFAENVFVNNKIVSRNDVSDYYKPYMPAVLYTLNTKDEINKIFIGQDAIDSTGNTSAVSLTAEQTNGCEIDLTLGEASYYKTESDRRTTKIRIDNGISIYINKNLSPLPSYSYGIFESDWSQGRYSDYVLFDTDNNGKYNIIYAVSHRSGAVEYINLRTFKLGTTDFTIKLDPSNESYTFTITDVNGKTMELSEIQEGDAVTLFESSDGTYDHYDIVVARNQIEGMITEILDTVNIYGQTYATKVKINNIIYDVDVNCAERLNLKAGYTGIYTLDMYGKLIDYKPPKENFSYGYIFESYVDSTEITPELKTTIYTSEGKFETYGYTENVYLNSATEQVTQSYLQSSMPESICGQTFAVYVTDSDNKITKIYTGSYIRNTEEFNSKTNELVEYDFENEKLYNGKITENSILATYYNTGENDSYNQLNYKLISKDYFKENYSYKVSFITDNDANIIMAMILKASEIHSQPVDPYSVPMYIESVRDTTGPDNTPVKIVNGYYEGEPTIIMVPSDAYVYSRKYLDRSGDAPEYKDAYASVGIDSLKKGAMIQFVGTEAPTTQYEYKANVIKILVTSEDVAKMSVTNPNDIQDDNDDVEGFLYGGSVYRIINNKRIVFEDGNEVSFLGSDYAACIKMNNKSIRYILGDYHFSDVETTYAPYSEDEINDDILIIYKFNGIPIGAIIVDADADNY